MKVYRLQEECVLKGVMTGKQVKKSLNLKQQGLELMIRRGKTAKQKIWICNLKKELKMSENKDLIETMIKALKEFNAGCVQVSFDEYHIMVCTDKAHTVMNAAYDIWMLEDTEE